MSTATDLLSTAKNNGLLLSLEGENLRVRWQGVPPSQDLLASIKTHKQELISLLAINDHPYIEDRPPTWNMDRYANMVKCQQCEHLTDDGHCRAKPQYKPMPEAMRDCASFDVLKTERISIENAPYSATELNDLLNRYEKKLFHHLVDCVACSFMDSRYCVDAFAIGSSYDAILLVFDDAASKRDALLNTVIRARISGRKVFVGIDYTNIGEPPQQAVKPLVYGISDSERLFVNHLMTCDKCKPTSRTYCADGLTLKANA